MSRYRVQYAPTAQAALEAMDRSLRNSFEQGMRQPGSALAATCSRIRTTNTTTP